LSNTDQFFADLRLVTEWNSVSGLNVQKSLPLIRYETEVEGTSCIKRRREGGEQDGIPFSITSVATHSIVIDTAITESARGQRSYAIGPLLGSLQAVPNTHVGIAFGPHTPHTPPTSPSPAAYSAACARYLSASLSRA
jgi:hypothetical protein